MVPMTIEGLQALIWQTISSENLLRDLYVTRPSELPTLLSKRGFEFETEEILTIAAAVQAINVEKQKTKLDRVEVFSKKLIERYPELDKKAK